MIHLNHVLKFIEQQGEECLLHGNGINDVRDMCGTSQEFTPAMLDEFLSGDHALELMRLVEKDPAYMQITHRIEADARPKS